MAERGFDDVIVGAGSAGCVLANRLSADPSRRVLLLEAGPRDKRKEIHIPAALTKTFKSEIDWAFTTEAEPALDDRRLYWPRGKVLGGSSSINAMLYVRGNPLDYERWQALGNPAWGWEGVLPFFLRAEDNARGASQLHGVGGPLRVEDPRHPNLLSRLFVEAGQERGWSLNPDFNGAEQEGFGLFQVTQKDGRRCSSARAYLHPVRRRPNLTVLTGAHARRVLFEGRRACGVEISHGGRLEQIRAEREVVLAAGAVGSPQLLLLSGVGAAEELRALGIEIVADLPGVGRNLQDHPCVSVVYRSREPITLDSAETFANLLRWLIFRRGPLTTTIAEAGAFLKTDAGLDRPDLQLHFLPAAIVDHGFVQSTDQGFNLSPTLVRPRSTGRITLASTDPEAAPRIFANYLAEPGELDTLIRGVEIVRELAASRVFDRYRDHEVLPGPEARSREDLARFVRATLQTLYHPVGSCRMGPESETRGERRTVVGADLRVHGLEGLRVVDASVMPEIPTGNTNAPTIMIAEKAAAMILG